MKAAADWISPNLLEKLHCATLRNFGLREVSNHANLFM